MKFRIHNRKVDDFIDIEGETVEEIREIAFYEEERRGWLRVDMWSEQLDEEEGEE